jgi:hypothetical protein
MDCFWFFETGSHYATQAGLELAILLPGSPEHWDCRHEPPCLALNRIFRLKSEITKIKSLLDAINRRMEGMKERIGELKARTIEITNLSKQRENG